MADADSPVPSTSRSTGRSTDPSASATEVATKLGRIEPWLRPAAIGLGASTALLPVLAAVALNSPLSVPVDVAEHHETLRTIGIAGPALGATVLGLTTRDPLQMIGWLFVGAFGLLATVAPGAWLPAAVAVPAGGALITVTGLSTLPDPRSAGRWVAAGLVLAGVVVSLLAVAGFRPVLARPVGAHIALAGAALSPLWVEPRPLDWTVGAIALVGVVVVAATAPFVLGAVLLVAGGVVGTSVAVVALAVGGLAVAASVALRRARYRILAGLALLLAAGAPASLPAAIAATLGLAVLVEATTPRSRGGVSS